MSHELADITYVSLEYCIKQANKLVAWFKLLDPYISWYEVLLHFHKYSAIGFGAQYREFRFTQLSPVFAQRIAASMRWLVLQFLGVLS